MALSRNDVKRPVLAKETVDVPALGGEVIVRAMLASEHLGLIAEQVRRHSAAGDGDAGGALGAEFAPVSRLLALVVIDEQGQPLLDAGEWEAFGGQNPHELLRLHGVAKRLSGIDAEDVQKNS